LAKVTMMSLHVLILGSLQKENSNSLQGTNITSGEGLFYGPPSALFLDRAEVTPSPFP
jgi:hypothetical protein